MMRNQLQQSVPTGGLTGRDKQVEMSNQSNSYNRFQGNNLIKQNPYQNIDGEDRTDLASSIEMLKSSKVPQNFGNVVSGSHEFQSQAQQLRRGGSGFLEGSSIDCLVEVLQAQHVYALPALSRGRAIKKKETETLNGKDQLTSQVLQDSESMSLDASVELKDSHRSKPSTQYRNTKNERKNKFNG